MGKKAYKILIVSDEMKIREKIRKFIERGELGIEEVYTAVSGTQALSVVEWESPEIMITDIRIPEMSGLELIEQAIKLRPGMRVLVLIGQGNFEFARRCLRLQVQDFLLKPISGDALAESVRRQVAFLRESEITGAEEEKQERTEEVWIREQDRVRGLRLTSEQNEDRKKQIFQEIYREFQKEMLEGLNDYGYGMRVFETFCVAVDSYDLSEPYLRKCCFEAATAVYYECMVRGRKGDRSSLGKFAESLNGSNRRESLELTRQYLVQLYGGEDEDIHEIVGKAKCYINRHLAEELSVSGIAEHLFVSPNYFSRLFKREAGQGCSEYIARKRIEKACVLLETTNFNTGKIAVMVGYNDTNYFSVAFKRQCGMSPTRYRREARGA